jgi:oligopeptide transport system ATP-binding protein
MLHVKDLFVSFKLYGTQLTAVRGASFTLNAGESLAIVGESGSGKSTLAKALVKLLPPSAQLDGEVLLHKENLLLYSEKKMQQVRGKQIAAIFQDPIASLNPTLKIGAQITEGYLRHHKSASFKEARQEALELLHLAGIPSPQKRIDDYPHTLSGGMRQRVMIALALASKPKILIADEPTTALDVTIQAQILDLLQKVKEQMGMSIILITHDLSVVARFCDRVLVMYAGEIVEEAPVEHLFASPAHPYTQRLLESIPRLDRPKTTPLVPIEGAPPSLSAPISGCAFYARCHCRMERCQTEKPPLTGEDHKTRCLRS